ncbi:alcohol dehydrogenase class-3-like [Dorcoceras hygrometricum]|uniref:Alcohol dehydrogenase class-3-like n=1 Tax=Dorcoceras hygrometricum TaxID=472368 RepID=A0A2Z7AS68_9LAMI|nr:alcohol dehydrogenase class-3-like [Dorcoceras hygrometricum]
MRIRPPELETSICDAKYHVSLVGVSRPAANASASGKPQNQQVPKLGVPIERPTCQNFRRQHSGKFMMGAGVCYKFKQSGHFPLPPNEVACYQESLCDAGRGDRPRNDIDHM